MTVVQLANPSALATIQTQAQPDNFTAFPSFVLGMFNMLPLDSSREFYRIALPRIIDHPVAETPDSARATGPGKEGDYHGKEDWTGRRFRSVHPGERSEGQPERRGRRNSSATVEEGPLTSGTF
jgi:hypothetical protein